jgi:type I restriction enzyme S subunit
MRRSILRAAFEGELAPADPTDEPAEILLKRIEEDRASRVGFRAARKRTVRKPRSTLIPHTEEMPK